MIYEKRGAELRIKREDMPVKNVTHFQKEESPAGKANAVSQGCEDALCKKMRLFSVKRRKRTRAKRVVLAALIAALCVFAVDARFFGGRIEAEIVTALKNGVGNTLENISEKTTSGKSTLYTRLLSDRSYELFDSQKDVTEKEADEAALQRENPTLQTLEVSGSTSESFVDGERFCPITTLDLSAESTYSLTNATDFSPDLEKLSKAQPKALEGLEISDEPLVLILHTHAEECYTGYSKMYPEDEATRTADTEKNVVRVGKEIKDTLSDFGISALHCTTMHDSHSFINAYSGSAASVKQYLEKYPSIRVVVDVHRDAIIKDDGESIRAVAEIAGQEYAQLMFVVGTNELGHNHPGWRDNLALALTLQESMDSTYPSLCRSINLRDVPFNQQLSSGYLLLEVGTCANTLDEALRSARAFGENLARVFASAA